MSYLRTDEFLINIYNNVIYNRKTGENQILYKIVQECMQYNLKAGLDALNRNFASKEENWWKPILYNTSMLTFRPLLSVRRCGDLIWAVWSKSKKIFRLLISLGNAENHQYVWSKDDLNLLEEILSLCLILIWSASNRDGEKKISSPHHP